MDFSQLASSESVTKTTEALESHNIHVVHVATGQEAKQNVLDMIPEGADVMNMTSVTLTKIGLDTEILESTKFHATKNRLAKMDDATEGHEKRRLGAAPEYAIGSVHAVTEDGSVVIASNTGSQLPAYAYGAKHVIWVVSTKKIVPNLDEAMKRIYDYVLPQESVRLNAAYGISTGSFVSKILIINREISHGRVTMVLVDEELGF